MQYMAWLWNWYHVELLLLTISLQLPLKMCCFYTSHLVETWVVLSPPGADQDTLEHVPYYSNWSDTLQTCFALITLFKLITAVWVSCLHTFKTFIFVKGLNMNNWNATQFCIKDFMWLDWEHKLLRPLKMAASTPVSRVLFSVYSSFALV